MTRLIKITKDAIPEWARKDTWVAVDHIVMVQDNGTGSTIVLASGPYLDVVEKPAEVLAMIERADVVLATEAAMGERIRSDGVAR